MARIIALDWGTTHLRAALLDADGTVLEKRTGESGVGQLSKLQFAERFRKITQGWDASVAVACGMVGSRQGWMEAPYVTCPSALDAIAGDAVHFSVDDREVLILPGLTIQRSSGSHDVMRGEETQLAGFDVLNEEISNTVVLPGTHSKWALLDGGVVRDFVSYMTGDLFDAVCNHTLLSHSMDEDDGLLRERSFRQGVSVAKAAHGVTWSRLFAIRADSLIEGDGLGGQRDYLSGLLIGSEIANAQAEGFFVGSISVIGGCRLVERYEQAFDVFDRTVSIYDGGEMVWKALGVIGQNVIKERAKP